MAMEKSFPWLLLDGLVRLHHGCGYSVLTIAPDTEEEVGAGYGCVRGREVNRDAPYGCVNDLHGISPRGDSHSGTSSLGVADERRPALEVG